MTLSCRQMMCFVRRLKRDLDSCLQKFHIALPEVEPISPGDKALLSFIQALLRRQY